MGVHVDALALGLLKPEGGVMEGGVSLEGDGNIKVVGSMGTWASNSGM